MRLAESFGHGATTSEVKLLIHRIETADPNGETNEDNLGAQWGHAQFANWRAHLTLWEAVGSPEIARRLLAAIIKTVNVSRQLRKLNGEPSPGACLAECYLREVGQVLWDLWKKSGGVSHSRHSHVLLVATWPRAEAYPIPVTPTNPTWAGVLAHPAHQRAMRGHCVAWTVQ